MQLLRLTTIAAVLLAGPAAGQAKTPSRLKPTPESPPQARPLQGDARQAFIAKIGKSMAIERMLPPEFGMAIPGIVVGTIGLILTVKAVRQ